MSDSHELYSPGAEAKEWFWTAAGEPNDWSWTIPKEYSWGQVTKVTEIESEVSEATVQTKESLHDLAIFAHPRLAFDLVTCRDLAH